MAQGAPLRGCQRTRGRALAQIQELDMTSTGGHLVRRGTSKTTQAGGWLHPFTLLCFSEITHFNDHLIVCCKI